MKNFAVRQAVVDWDAVSLGFGMSGKMSGEHVRRQFP